MAKITYVNKRFSKSVCVMIEQANVIIEEYAEQGYDLTLRQLYYQFVSRDLIPNRQSEYDRLGRVISNARLAGLIDWDAIVDRTRNLRKNSHWSSPRSIIDTCVENFAIDKWAFQKFRPEVWIEKDALLGVISGICEKLDVPYFSCRGYTSQSEMWRTSQRLRGWIKRNQMPVIFHLGDHDPSGIDMTRDIRDRLSMFCGEVVSVFRLALNMEQVEAYTPPPNPTKLTDTRAKDYIAIYGSESWELDALAPDVMAWLIEDAVDKVCDEEGWLESVKQEERYVKVLANMRDNWEDIADQYGGD